MVYRRGITVNLTKDQILTAIKFIGISFKSYLVEHFQQEVFMAYCLLTFCKYLKLKSSTYKKALRPLSQVDSFNSGHFYQLQFWDIHTYQIHANEPELD